MNIGLFTDTYYPEVNGVANSVYQLKKELESRGHLVYVFTVSNLQAKEEEHVFRIKSIPFFLQKDRRIGCTTISKWLPIVARLHLDIIHTQTEFTIGYMGYRISEKLRIPVIHTYHTIYEEYTHYLKIPGNEKLKGIIRSYSRYCCNRAGLVIVPTGKVKKLLVGYGVKRRIVVQPTGIDKTKFSVIDYGEVRRLKERYGLLEDKHILFSIGRLSHEKNIQELIQFVGKIQRIDSKVHLLIVGDGPEKAKLIQLIKKMRLEKYITFTGEVEWENIQQYYALGDVFVCASTSETQGLTYVEALASGKPLLVRRDECLQGILEEGRNGYSYQCEEEFIKNYEKLFLDNNHIGLEYSTRDIAVHVCSESFGLNIEKTYREIKVSETKGNYVEGMEGYEENNFITRCS